MPPYIHLGGKLFNSPGVGGGVFGSACEPVMINNPLASQVDLPQFALSADISASRFQHRALPRAGDAHHYGHVSFPGYVLKGVALLRR